MNKFNFEKNFTAGQVRSKKSVQFIEDSGLQERNFSRKAGVYRTRIVQFLPDSGVKVSGLSRDTCYTITLSDAP